MNRTVSWRARAAAIAAVALVATVVSWLQPTVSSTTNAATSVPGGPVILDGNDPGDHVADITSYVRSVYAALNSRIAVGYVHNDKVAVIGPCDQMLSSMLSGTAMAGQVFDEYATAASVEALLANIGANNYKMIHICSDEDASAATMLSQQVEDELDKWGSALAAHVNRGGGLFSTGHSYNWLGDLFPTITVTPGGTSNSYVTTDGTTFFGLPNNTLVNAINHYTFGSPAGTPLLPLLSESTNGGGKRVALGGVIVRFPQISISGPTSAQIGDTATYVLEAATADGIPISSNSFTYTISGPTSSATTTGTGTTDANGNYTFTLSGNAAGTTEIRVRMNLGGGGVAGSAKSTVWAGLPGAPAITSATDVVGEDGSVQLAWNAPASDGGRAITDYAIQWSTDGTTWTTFVDGVSTTRSAKVTGLADDVVHQFQVAAINSIGQGPWSPIATARTIGSPAAPVVTATGSDGTVDASWNTPAGNGAAVSHYIVEYRLTGASTWTTASSNHASTSRAIGGLVNGQSYDVRVRAVNANGSGAWSNEATATPFTTPDQVRDLQVIEGDQTITVEWEDPAFDGGSAITGYAVTTDFGGVCVPEHFMPEDAPTRHMYRCVFTGLTNGDAYEVTVAAENAAGTGTSDAVTGVPFGLPSDVTVTVTDHDGKVTVDWTAADANGRPITEYRVYVDGNLAGTFGPTELTTEITGLTNGTSYAITVVADNAAGTGVAGSATGRPFGPALAPVVTVVEGDTALAITWTEADGNGRPVTGYVITVDGQVHATVSPSPRQLTITGLTNGQAHAITVAAVTEAGNGAPGAASGTPVRVVLGATLPAGVPVGGAPVTATGGGVRPNTTVVITLVTPDGTRIELGTTQTDGDGGYETVVNLPAGLTTGSYEIITETQDRTGQPVRTSTSVFVDWSGSTAPAPNATRGYTAIPPIRVLDTRHTTKVEAGTTYRLVLDADWGLPSGISAIAANVTVTEPESDGFLTAYPCTAERPTASLVNFTTGATVPNLVLSAIQTGGELCIYTTATAHLVVDVNGYQDDASQERMVSIPPIRIVDTRGHARLARGEVYAFDVIGDHMAAPGSSAVLLNVTATEADAAGFLTVYPCGTDAPVASNVNYLPIRSAANHTITKVGAGGKVCVFSQSSAELVVDLNGYFHTDGDAGLVGMIPGRVVDTRHTTKLLGGQTLRVHLVGEGGAPAGTTALALNVTATEAEADGFLTVYPCGGDVPVASNLNYGVGRTVANHVTANVGTNGDVCVYTQSTTHIVIDVEGAYNHAGAI